MHVYGPKWYNTLVIQHSEVPMSTTIDKITVAPDRISADWGVDAYDYKLNGARTDLQD